MQSLTSLFGCLKGGTLPSIFSECVVTAGDTGGFCSSQGSILYAIEYACLSVSFFPPTDHEPALKSQAFVMILDRHKLVGQVFMVLSLYAEPEEFIVGILNQSFVSSVDLNYTNETRPGLGSSLTGMKTRM